MNKTKKLMSIRKILSNKKEIFENEFAKFVNNYISRNQVWNFDDEMMRHLAKAYLYSCLTTSIQAKSKYNDNHFNHFVNTLEY